MESEKNALLTEWDGKVRQAVRDADKQIKLFERWRNAVDLAKRDNEPQRKVQPYLIHSALASLIPALYAKNPEMEIRPVQSAVAQAGPSAWPEFARTAETLLQRELVQGAELKLRMKAVLLSVLTTGYGCLKLGLQADYPSDPVLHNRLPDAQDNVAELDRLNAELADSSGADEELLREKLARQTEHVEAALNGEQELFVQKGLVLDRVASEDFFVLDESVSALSDYRQAAALAQRVWMTAAQYKRLFDVAELPKGAALHNKAGKSDTDLALSPKDAESLRQRDGLLEVWEVWCKEDGFVYTFAQGAQEWARPPYQPQPVGERFYPFFVVQFNQVDGRFYPLSDVQTLEDFQDEYAHLRSQIRNVRQMNKPVFIVPKAGTMMAGGVQKLVETVRDNEFSTWLAADIPPNVGVNTAVQQFPPPQVNFGMYDPSMIFRDVEMMTRSGDAARGYINKAKTATEAEIMSMGMQSGIAERQDVLEDMMRELAQYALEIMLQAYAPEDVMRILGTEQTAWQNVPLDVAFRHLAVEIRAGSMSKPNKFQEREQWTNLIPALQETVMQIGQLQAANQHSLALVLRRIMAETLRRFDDRLDLDEFLPDEAALMMPPQLEQTGAM